MSLAKNRLQPDIPFAGDSPFTLDFQSVSKKRRKEAIVLLCLACIGIFGFIYVLNCIHSKPTQTLLIQQEQRASAALTGALISPRHPEIEMSGQLSPLQDIHFRLLNYKKSGEYMIHFGDGINKKMNRGSVSHQYKNKGSYQVMIECLDSAAKSQVISKKIQIQ